jgi:hypothetical protein
VAKKKATKKKAALKSKAKKAGRKVKKAAKTDVGRAGIGAGVGALALGPIGAAAGAYVGLKHMGKKRAKKNPDVHVKIASAVGVAMLDYHNVSENVEHVAASAIRGEKVDLDIIKAARKDLLKSAKQQTATEKDQMEVLAESLGDIVAKYSATKLAKPRLPNPARAFKLETEVGRGRQRRAVGAAGRATRATAAAGDASSASRRKRLAAINPGGKKRKHNVPVTNPRHGARGGRGKFESRYTPTEEEIGLLRRAGMLKRIEGLPPDQIERIVKGLRKEHGRKVDSKMKAKIAAYKRRLYEHEVLMRRFSPLPEDLARAKRRLDDANEDVIIAAKLRGIEPIELTRIVAAAEQPNPRKKNPCIGLHFHGKDANELMEAAEASAERQVKGKKRNPGVISTQPGAELYESEIPSLGTLELLPRGVQIWTEEYIKQRRKRVSKITAKKLGWSAVRRAGYREGAAGWTRPKRRFNPAAAVAAAESILVQVPKPGAKAIQDTEFLSVKLSKIQEKGIRPTPRNIAEYFANKYPGRKGVYVVYLDRTPVAMAIRNEPHGKLIFRNPPKSIKPIKASKKAKKSSAREKASPADRLIRRCGKLWDHYCKRPGKKRLEAVLEHAETMKASTSKKVKAERTKCLRSANAEAKRLGMK